MAVIEKVSAKTRRNFSLHNIASLLLAGTALWSSLPAIAATKADDPVTGEQQVNQTNRRAQTASGAATSPNGDYVVVWTSVNQDGPESAGTYARRYSASGLPLTLEIPVNSTTTGDQTAVGVATDAAGDFVVTWTGIGQDGDGAGTYARVFNADGVALTGEIQVNTTTARDQTAAGVAMDPAGDFVVTWTSVRQDSTVGGGVYARRFTLAGVPVTGEIPVNVRTIGNQSGAGVAMDAQGNFAVTWAARDAFQFYYGTFARRFTAAGVATTPEIHVNSSRLYDQTPAGIASDAAGNFVVTWTGGNFKDSSFKGIFARRFGITGALLTGEIQVNAAAKGNQFTNAIASDAAGNFVVAWNSAGDGSGVGTYVRRFSAAGIAQSGDIQVNTFTEGNQVPAGIGMDADGDYVVAWTSQIQDNHKGAVESRRFAGAENVDVSLSASSGPGTTNPTAAFDFTYIVTNPHPSVAPTSSTAINEAIGSATGVHVDVTLPADLTIVRSRGTDWKCDTVTAGTLSCNYSGNLPANTSTSFAVTARNFSGVPVSTTAVVSANQYDANPVDNIASASH